ncbi:MAG: MerR family transcriptional regulator, partial [Rubrivivax sp.]|nr:MerR family transcriptional regulator [Rubrivivax sp.]
MAKPKPQRRASGAAPSAAPAAQDCSVIAPAALHHSGKAPAAANRSGPAPTAQHRSGAVARMLRMPVATLRVWERRYRLTQPALSPSGQRLYSAGDVQRLALLKQLTDLGHAIGSLAPLDMRQLQQVAATHAQALAARSQGGGLSEARLQRRGSGVSGVSGVSR